MSDNIRATPSTGSTGALFATDELTISGSTDIVHVPLTKLGYGVADSFTYASSNNPYPVFIHGSTALSVSGSTVSVSGSSVTLNGVSSNAGLPVFIYGSTTLSVSGSTVSVSGSSVTLNGVSSNAGLPVFIYGSTTLSVSGSTVSVSGSSVTLNGVSSNAGLPVFIYGSTTLSVSGSTVSVSGSTISVSGSSVTLNGVSSDAGLPVRIMGSTTISVSGSTISVSGSSVTLNGVSSDAGLPVRIMGSTTLSVSGSTVSVVNGSTFLVQPQAYASGGASPYSFLSTTTVQAAAIKASAGTIYNISMFSTDTGTNYVRLYDQTTTPASTDDANIKFRGVVPGSSDGAGFIASFPLGISFGTGIGLRVSAGSADTDATVLAAGELRGNVGFK